MKLFKILIVIIVGGISLLSCSSKETGQSDKTLKLWYDEPATYFEESLVLGNGKLGASVFGGASNDSIYLNDITLWSGEPVNPNMNPEAHKYIPLIREALANEDYQAADRMSRKVQGKFSESFAPLGTMYLDFDHQGEIHNYRRELDISNAIATTEYKAGKVNYVRNYFVSNPDSVMVIDLRADADNALNFRLRFKSLLTYETSVSGDTFVVSGYAPYHAEPNYRGDMADAVLFSENRGTKFTTLFKIKETDGVLTSDNEGLTLKNGTFAVVLISTETSFNGFDKDPAVEGKDNEGLALKYLNKTLNKSLKNIKETHSKDYTNLFDRVQIDVGTAKRDTIPTDQRLKDYSNGVYDPDLEELYFQFGRYLLISSSRTVGVPANLQGLWNPYLRPPWSSNYTVNINVEENYWLAEPANLSELHMPFLTWVKNVSQTGNVTAKTFLGIQEGWMAGHNSDIWAMSNPVGDFGDGHPVWANWYLGGGWLSTHIWEHYSFSKDKDFLQEYYPILKGSALFCLNWLIEKEGELITSPSSSPENLYRTHNGYVGATLYGATADIAIIREVFEHTILASKVLDVDYMLSNEIEAALGKLRPYKIGKRGNLQEWYHDWDDYDPKHRHQTHLFGLYPGHQINVVENPDLSEAVKKSLEIKGDESTGWSKGWRINLWARLLDGNHAYKMYRELLTYVDPSGLATNYSSGGGTYPNLLDAHPPFQIDGNFGGAAGMAEMLIQSNEHEVVILPALPEAWPHGSFNGLCARGGFELDVQWNNGELVTVTVRSKTDGDCLLKYKDLEINFTAIVGEEYTFDKSLNRI